MPPRAVDQQQSKFAPGAGTTVLVASSKQKFKVSPAAVNFAAIASRTSFLSATDARPPITIDLSVRRVPCSASA
ncbi:hypothetical protein DB30_06604 [Enhygromyxa salina]|uniref:Uncharacterized protein n=1 Tax=Enhygromyxa salina TaxID=215803 RepID=A0A0C2A6I6_9BACT|nr:hypothetical protein DB30_06604 [Enhygromyxa salina]